MDTFSGSGSAGAASAQALLPAPEPLPDLIATVLAPLRRSDQRRTAEQFVSGLLTTKGRKTARRLASRCADPAAEQRLHHFVSSSPWSWAELRAELARYLDRVTPPEAWVVHPLVIPKTGRHSVGVGRRVVPGIGRVNGQLAYGLWSCSRRLTTPVAWRLDLSDGWLTDPSRRREAGIPEHCVTTVCPTSAIVRTLAPVREWDLAPRPVVMDARATAPNRLAELFDHLERLGLPALLRVDGSVPLRTRGTVAPGRPGAVAVRHLLNGAPQLRRAVPGGELSVALLDVALPTTGHRPRGPLDDTLGPDRGGVRLFAVWIRSGAPRYWLTDLPTAGPQDLLRLTTWPDRVAGAAAAEQVGLRDFEGRTFHGWHRHMTLASIAHASMALTSGPPPDAAA
jgi:hypothetical protein